MPAPRKYIQQYTNTAGQQGSSGMPCLTKASDPDMELKKCYQFGGYSGHRGASGTAGRTFRVYTGPLSSYGALRAHEKAMKDWIDAQEEALQVIWTTMGARRHHRKGKSGANRFNVPFDCMGECKRTQKELGARFIGRSYRLKEADKAYAEQKALNDALAEGGGVTQLNIMPLPLTLEHLSTTPKVVKVLPGIGAARFRYWLR